METMKPVKLFVLGRPGTGKSSAARLLTEIVHERGWHAQHIDDYGILDSMYQKEAKDKDKKEEDSRFCKASEKLEGFDVIDPAVFDEALAEMRVRVERVLTRILDRMNLVIIEFARGTYRTSLHQFGRYFLQESYFLFLDSDIDTCMARITHRVKHPVYEGDRFMSRKAMERLYSTDAIPSTRAMLKTEYGIDAKRIRVIYNLFSEEVFLSEVYQFIERVIRQEAASYCEKR